MPIEAVKIPQNVYVEDRIIGPVTLRQLIISGLGAGLSYAIFATLQRAGVSNPVPLVLAWIPAVICVAFAFLKINDLSLFSIILLAIESTHKSNQRYWSPHGGISINLITSQHVKALKDQTEKAAANTDKIVEITRQLERRQKEMHQLATHDMPSPQSTESIKTQLEHSQEHGLYEHEETEAPEPVRQNDVQANGLDKKRSIDSITDAVKAYEALTNNPPSNS